VVVFVVVVVVVVVVVFGCWGGFLCLSLRLQGTVTDALNQVCFLLKLMLTLIIPFLAL
jgi:hypothetical protein